MHLKDNCEIKIEVNLWLAIIIQLTQGKFSRADTCVKCATHVQVRQLIHLEYVFNLFENAATLTTSSFGAK